MSGDLEPYFEEDDGHGCVLAVHGYDGKALVRVTDDSGRIPVHWIADPLTAPDLCRAICEAAGVAPPVMLGRPEVNLAQDVHIGPLRAWLAGDGEVTLALGGSQSSARPHQVRQFAAAAVALADAAEAPEPGPAEVEDVADAIRAAFQSGGTPPAGWERKAARAALAWVRGREAGRG